MSTTHDPKAAATGTPPRTAHRTAITIPPSCENGSTSEAASRIRRPHMNAGAGPLGEEATTHHAKPKGAKRPTCTAMTTRKPPTPIGRIAESTPPRLL